MNIAETIFEKYCTRNGIRFDKISRINNQRTPDYKIFGSSVEILTEVTSINTNSEERKILEKLKTKPLAYWPNTENKLRRKINDKANQIRAYANNNNLTLIVFFDNRGKLASLNSDDFRFAMYGNDSISFLYDESGKHEPILKGNYFGGDRRMTDEYNTTISGLGHLKILSNDEIELDLYHNHFAQNPIPADIASIFFDNQFKIDSPFEGEQSNWKQLK